MPVGNAIVMLVVQIGLFVAGALLLVRQTVQCDGKELRSPFTVFAGLILCIQLPIAVGIGFALGGAEGTLAARRGEDLDTVALLRKYRWLDLAVPGLAVVAAGAIAAAGMREICFLPPPPDEPIGITDYRLRALDPWDDAPDGEPL